MEYSVKQFFEFWTSWCQKAGCMCQKFPYSETYTDEKTYQLAGLGDERFYKRDASQLMIKVHSIASF
jgi:hypothetical protein